MKKQVKFLSLGDVLSGGATIVAGPTRGLRTPAGKVEIGVQYPNGNVKLQEWNASTVVTLKPKQ